MARSKDRRVESFAMRVSVHEHQRLKEASEAQKMSEAQLIRESVNEWCFRRGIPDVFQ